MLSGLNAMGTVHQLILHRGIEGARKEASSDKTDRLCVEAAYEVMADEDGRIGIAHAGFAMTALPHKRITETVWERDGLVSGAHKSCRFFLSEPPFKITSQRQLA